VTRGTYETCHSVIGNLIDDDDDDDDDDCFIDE
jgi:hypothetical protein